MLLRNTILYNIAFIIISASVAVGGALMLSNMRNKRGSKVYQTMMFLPYFMSWVVISYFVYALLTPERGYVNGVIRALGGEGVMWYQEPKYWPFHYRFPQYLEGYPATVIPQIKEELMKAGWQDVMDEAQRQVDEFKGK